MASGAEGRAPYLAQEYVVGEALDASLRQYGSPPLDSALLTLGWLAEGLDRAAGEGIHHGALHPRDAIVSTDGARIIDVGVAEALQRAGLRAPVRRPYSAPERVDGRAWGGSADIFALGAIAYELVTGRRVPGPGVPSLSVEGMTGLDHVTLGEILARALAVDSAARFASASDLVDVLRPVLARARRVSLARRRRGVPDGTVQLPLDHGSADAAGNDAAAEPAVDVAFPESLTAVPAADLHDPSDLPLTMAEAPAASGTVPDRVTRRPRSVIAPIEPESPGPASAAVFQGPTWRGDEPDRVSRWSLASILVALIVGLSGGFGLGYWFAWRAALREHPALSTQAVQEAPPSARVEEPQVKPEPAAPAPPSAQVPAARPQTAAPAEPATPPANERARGKRESAPPGKLLIRSTPSGARVSINGRVRGRTPLILRDMPLRVLSVTVAQPGYKPSEQRVALSAARPTATVEAKLVAEAAETAAGATTGSLFVESRPSSAQVFIDNRSIGTTPVSVPDLSPGNHRVRLELAGFTSWVTMAEVKAGARTRVSASLEQQ